MSKYHFSKSRYCNGIQCPKMLWLKKNMPDEFDDSVMNQAILSAGNDVGDLAMGLFGDYTEVPYSESLSEMIPAYPNLTLLEYADPKEEIPHYKLLKEAQNLLKEKGSFHSFSNLLNS